MEEPDPKRRRRRWAWGRQRCCPRILLFLMYELAAKVQVKLVFIPYLANLPDVTKFCRFGFFTLWRKNRCELFGTNYVCICMYLSEFFSRPI